jgi:hypothetical protein
MSGNKDKQRPEGHWIKRPPRPSKQAAPPPRRKPGLVQAMIAGSVGIMLGMLYAAVTGAGGLPDPVPAIAAGIGLCIGAIATWRLFGGTRQDFRDLFY